MVPWRGEGQPVGSRLGTSGLQGIVRACAGHPAQDMVGAVHAGLVNFVGALHLSDDVTIIAVRVHGGVERQVFTFESAEDELQTAVERILEFLRRSGLVAEREGDARLVMTEVLANAVEHGNAHARERKVTVRLRSDGERADVTVRDEGPGYDVDAVWDAIDATDAGAPRGRGLYLVAKHAPACRVNRIGNQIRIPVQKGMF